MKEKTWISLRNCFLIAMTVGSTLSFGDQSSLLPDLRNQYNTPTYLVEGKWSGGTLAPSFTFKLKKTDNVIIDLQSPDSGISTNSPLPASVHVYAYLYKNGSGSPMDSGAAPYKWLRDTVIGSNTLPIRQYIYNEAYLNRSLDSGTYTIMLYSTKYGENQTWTPVAGRYILRVFSTQNGGSAYDNIQHSSTIYVGHPTILKQPSSIAVKKGSLVVLSVRCSTLVTGFQWFRKVSGANVKIPGAVAEDYNILSTSNNDTGSYQCAVIGDTTFYVNTWKTPPCPQDTPNCNHPGTYRGNDTTRWTMSATARVTYSDTTRSTVNNWNQTEFLIGSASCPTLTFNPVNAPLYPKGRTLDSVALARYRRAHFNVLCGMFNNTVIADANGYFITPFPRPAENLSTNAYVLDIASTIPGLKAYISDTTIAWDCTAFDSAGIVAMATRYNNNLTAAQKSILCGFALDDEPWYNKQYLNNWPDRGPEYTYPIYAAGNLHAFMYGIGEHLKKVELLSSLFPQCFSVINHSGLGGIFDTLPFYKDYANKYALNNETRLISFDHDPFNPDYNNGPYLGYQTNTFFLNQAIFAQAVKNADSVGKQINFWCFPQLTDNYSSHDSTPPFDSTQLHFMINSSLIYGAKGVKWCQYAGFMDSCYADWHVNYNIYNYDNYIYNNVSLVNAELERMGPYLMNMKWIKTIHGNKIDPFMGEINLPTKDSGQSLLSTSQTISDSLAIGMMKDKYDSTKYLLIFNKNCTVQYWNYNNKFTCIQKNDGSGDSLITGGRHLKIPATWELDHRPCASVTQTILANGQRNPAQFDKTTGNWILLLNSATVGTSTTSFPVTITPGALEIISLNGAPLNPNTLISTIE